jgi:hypothetical protein
MIAYHSSAKLGNVVLEVDQVLGLLVSHDIVEVNVLVAPFEVVDDALIRQLLLHYKDVLKELNDSLFNVEMVKLGDHRLLILGVLLVLVYQRVSFVDDVSNVVKDGAVVTDIQG